jgi:GH24 family phage-related lysozyme (muramidase)/cytochrome c556
MVQLPTYHDLGIATPDVSRTTARANLGRTGRAMQQLGATIADAAQSFASMGARAATGGTSTKGGYSTELAVQEFLWNEERALYDAGMNVKPDDLATFTDNWQKGYFERSKKLVGDTPKEFQPYVDQKLFAGERTLFNRSQQFQDEALVLFESKTIDQAVENRLSQQAAEAQTLEDFERVDDNARLLIGNATLSELKKAEKLEETRRKLAEKYLYNAPAQDAKFVVDEATTPITAARLIRKFEGFEAAPYDDGGTLRIGFGSDTITTEAGEPVKVRAGMVVSPQDAERDLQRRVKEKEGVVIENIGEDAYKALPQQVQAVLISLAYNGALKGPIINAAKNRDLQALATAIETTPSRLPGLRTRRETEARVVREAAQRGGRPVEGAWQNIKIIEDYRTAPGKVRKMKISDQTDFWARNAAAALANETGLDIGVAVVSGGQFPEGMGPHTGSTRHDWGGSADIMLVVNGKRTTPAQAPALYQKYLMYAAASGATGLGHYPGFVHVGGGSVAAWGPNGSKTTLDPAFAAAIEQGRAMKSGGWAKGKFKGVPTAGPVNTALLPEAFSTLTYDEWQKWQANTNKRYETAKADSLTGFLVENAATRSEAIDVLNATEWSSPEARQDAEALLNKRFDAREEALSEERAEMYDQIEGQVTMLAREGKTAQALGLVPAPGTSVLTDKQVATLHKIAFGNEDFHNQALYDDLVFLRDSPDMADRMEFMRTDLRPMQTELSSAAYKELSQAQQGMQERFGADGRLDIDPAMKKADDYLKMLLGQMGVSTTPSAEQSDIYVRRAMMRLVKEEIAARQANKGDKPLLTEDITDAVDDVFFYTAMAPKRTFSDIFRLGPEKDEPWTMKEVMEKFVDVEEGREDYGFAPQYGLFDKAVGELKAAGLPINGTTLVMWLQEYENGGG